MNDKFLKFCKFIIIEIPESTTSDESLVTQIEPSANSNLFMPCDSMKFTSEYQDNVVSSSTTDNLQNGPC